MEESKNSNSEEFTAGDNFFGQMIEAGVADNEFIREIVEMFLSEGNQSLMNLRKSFEEGNKEQVRLFAHKLKSSFLMFDMNEAHELAVKIEQAEPENSAENITALEDICRSTFQLLQNKYLK